MTPAQPNQFSPRVLKVLPTGPATEMPQYAAPDAALQQKVLAPVAATLGLNFEGLGLGQYGFLMQYAPPDTNGTVGATQYVQWVNAEFAVFSKTSGALVAGPTPGNALWAGFGGGCQSNNDGDPIVQYDKIANRWIFTQFSVSTTPYLQCVAVSTTSDATGTYNRYAFQFANFPDYPKLGVWPDAYYISFNMYAGGFVGADACAMDRSKMLAGQAATIVCFQQGSLIGSLLPSDMDGTIQPAAGEQAFFMNFGSSSLRLWKFHVNFTNPASSTFTGPTTLSVAAFTPQCFSACVVQPGTTQKLDALGDRLMYRLAYRKFTDGHEALVVNHSITTGERWYEVRNPNGTPAVFQQGTFSPDSNTRWMGSVAMDHVGDMALGYSVSSGSVFPSIYFTGRIPGDPAGTMETEQLIVNGTGSQTSGLSRWGDYSAMAVDPVDDCTFWYTQEYIKSNGSFNWNTRIANFKFSNTGNFSLSATPSSQRIHPGDGANYTVTSTPGCGFTGTVSLTVAGLPTGASASFNPASIPNGAGSSTLNVSTSSNTPFGTYTLTITGTSGNLVQSVPVTLVVSNSWSWTLQTYTTCGTASFFGGGNLNSLQWHFLVEPSDPAGGQYTWTLFDSVGTFATGSYCGYEYCSPPTGNDGSNITASRLPVGTPSFRVYGQFKTSAGCSTSYSGQVQMQP
ncbi:MAG: hypothetical protein HY233_10445 [Acidobacteriales bacterium]|nr:hypothetical protein [Terriglobales bacterium]